MIAADLKALVATLRENGVTHYSGPLPGCDDVVQLELASLPRAAEHFPPAPRLEPTEPEPRGDDGLTKEQQAEWYRSSGG